MLKLSIPVKPQTSERDTSIIQASSGQSIPITLPRAEWFWICSTWSSDKLLRAITNELELELETKPVRVFTDFLTVS
jgi:hypothetical protein